MFVLAMLSAKSFRPSINTVEQSTRWLRIFAADIYSRLVDEGVERRPKVTTLHVRHGGETRSRQTPIHHGKNLTEITLFELAKTLLNQMIMEGNVWPCSNISLSVGGFEDVSNSGNHLISQFLFKGEAAKASNESARESSTERPAKKRRVEDNGIYKFFTKNHTTEEDDYDQEHQVLETAAEDGQSERNPDKSQLKQLLLPATFLTCERCKRQFGDEEELQSHSDWHFAKDLQQEDRSQSAVNRPSHLHKPGKTGVQSYAKKAGLPHGEKKVEKGQRRLNFGP